MDRSSYIQVDYMEQNSREEAGGSGNVELGEDQKK